MGVLLKTIFRSKLLTQKKSMNGLHKRLSINKRLSTSWQAPKSLTLEGIPMDSYKQHHRQPQAIKHLKFLRLPYLNPCLKLRPTSKLDKNPHSSLRRNLHSSLCKSLHSNLRSNLRSSLCKSLHSNLCKNLLRNRHGNL